MPKYACATWHTHQPLAAAPALERTHGHSHAYVFEAGFRPEADGLAEANAALTAASIDMFAALAALLDVWPSPDQPLDPLVARAFHRDARAAIAKAEGRAT